jgi:hypothetical protein
MHFDTCAQNIVLINVVVFENKREEGNKNIIFILIFSILFIVIKIQFICFIFAWMWTIMEKNNRQKS